MRSDIPFFTQDLTSAAVETLAEVEGTLGLYCGAGTTIDRTGLSWTGLVRSLLPQRRIEANRELPTRAEADGLFPDAPDQLASAVVHHLRVAAGKKTRTLKDELRVRLRKSLYEGKATWANGELSNRIVMLAHVRSILRLPTHIVTTNYDVHLEEEYERLRRAAVEAGTPAPGLRVYAVGDPGCIREEPPAQLDPERESSYIQLTYLHGRLPRTGQVSWPLVLDEVSYAASSPAVQDTLTTFFWETRFTLILGSSLNDPPLVRSLAMTRRSENQRVALMTKQSFPGGVGANGESTALRMAEVRNRELAITTVNADFHGQVPQFLIEAVAAHLRRGGDSSPFIEPYGRRLRRWWDEWSVALGSDELLPEQLRSALAVAAELLGHEAEGNLLVRDRERLRLELWVRQHPGRSNRKLVRWASSNNRVASGANGRQLELSAPSQAASVRAFLEGRPQLLCPGEIEGVANREYTWNSFLSVPIRNQELVPVGVMTLASTLSRGETTLFDTETTLNLVTHLRERGGTLLSVAG